MNPTRAHRRLALFVALALGLAAGMGLPGLAGFWGEFPAILAAYNPGAGLPEETFRGYMVVAALGTVFAAGYLLWLSRGGVGAAAKDG